MPLERSSALADARSPLDSADRIKLSRIDARIAEIERGSPAERRRLGEMLKALLAARAEIVRWDRREG